MIGVEIIPDSAISSGRLRSRAGKVVGTKSVECFYIWYGVALDREASTLDRSTISFAVLYTIQLWRLERQALGFGMEFEFQGATGQRVARAKLIDCANYNIVGAKRMRGTYIQNKC
jgi:hypothetical protein